jgi:hypothetical protein
VIWVDGGRHGHNFWTLRAQDIVAEVHAHMHAEEGFLPQFLERQVESYA